MNLTQLKAFNAVVKLGTFSKAAKELCVTGPAVFSQVRSLERYLGFKLLDKFGRDLRLTQVGHMLFSYTEKIFGLVEQAEKTIEDIRDLNGGTLNIGSTKAVAEHLMPLAISSFQEFYPKVKVLLLEGASEALVEGVLNYQFELAVVARLPYPNQIKAKPFSHDRIVAVVSPSSKLLNKRDVSLEELNDHPVIWRDAGSGVRSIVSAAFKKQGLKPSGIAESSNTEFIKDMVKRNKGYSFLGNICVRNEIENNQLFALQLKGCRLEVDIDIIYLKTKTLSPAAATFLSFLLQNSDLGDLSNTVDKMAGSA